jgi:uncharacterized protein (DUF885 family)
MAAREPLAALAETLAGALLRNDPFVASYLGVSGYDDAVPDRSPQARAAWRDSLVDVLIRCERLEPDAAGLGDQVLLGAVRGHASRALAAVDSRVEEFSVAALPMTGLPIMLLVLGRASVTDTASAAAVLSRCQRIPAYVDQCAGQLSAAASGGLLPVAPLVQDAITQLRDYVTHPARDPLLALRPPEGWDGAGAWRDELARAVRDGIYPALRRYIDLLAGLLPSSRPPDRAGLLYVPGGAAAYACCIHNGTTLASDAEEIHRFGLTALAELEERIAELGSRLWGARGAAEVMARMRSDPALTATTGQEVLSRTAAAIRRAENRLTEIFHPPLPPPCLAEPMPQQVAESGAPPMYYPPARDGSRPGAYLVNCSKPGAAGAWALEATAFHEAVPGHHGQLARLQLLPDLPLLLTAFGVVPHSEGWGLYAERLADEFGLYADDTQRLGALGLEAFRAVRLVADTGLHARGWSRARALEFALAHTPLPESFLGSEIDRYIVCPGQALGYLIGQRELLRLRQDAQGQLGSAFDIRDFHSAVLDHGTLPLPVLTHVIRAWITSARPA